MKASWKSQIENLKLENSSWKTQVENLKLEISSWKSQVENLKLKINPQTNHPPKVKNPSAKNPEINPQTNQPPKVKNPSAKNPGAYLHTAVRLYVYMCPPKETRSLEHIILKGQGLRVTRV